MPSKKIYYSEEDGSSNIELSAYLNINERLFVSITDPENNGHVIDFVTLNREDAIEFITDLANEFGLIDDSPELEGKKMWLGN